ncbi:MAG TPA: acyltransferase [Abditibacterium sp.]|jgi:maltose O-acetyltransferase
MSVLRSGILYRLKMRVSRTLHVWLQEVAENERERTQVAMLRNLKACGKGTKVSLSARIRGESKVELGENVHIGEGAFIAGEGGLFIGDNTHISRNLLLYTANHDYNGARLPYDNKNIHKPVHIGRNVWIGMNVCIAPGTVIGDGAIIGMGTTVSGEVPPLAIIGSQKWRMIGQRDLDHYQQLDERKAYSGKNGRALQDLTSDQRE